MILNDGSGTGVSASVLGNRRLLVDADSHESIITASSEGKAFHFGTGLITLTSAAASGLFYFKNNEVQNFIIAETTLRLNQSTGGASGVGLLEIIRNPTTGTLISTATAPTIRLNTNFGSTFTILADAFKGAEGLTVTDGLTYGTINGIVVPQRATIDDTIGIVIPRGASIAFRYTPPAGNTSIIISLSVEGYLYPLSFINV